MSHKLSLKRKLLAKRKLKAPLPPSVVVQEPVVVARDPPSAEPASPSATPALVTSASDSVAENQSGFDSNIVSQVKSMFASFAESLEARFSSIDQHFSQVISCFASTNIHARVGVSCQDVITNHSLTAPTPVAVRSDHPPNRAPSASYSDDLRTTPGGPAAVSVSSGATSLPPMSFADLMMTIQFFESSSGRVLDSFLDSLRAYIVVAPDFDLAIGGFDPHVWLALLRPFGSCSWSVPGRGQYCPVFVSPLGFLGFVTPHHFEC